MYDQRRNICRQTPAYRSIEHWWQNEWLDPSGYLSVLVGISDELTEEGDEKESQDVKQAEDGWQELELERRLASQVLLQMMVSELDIDDVCLAMLVSKGCCLGKELREGRQQPLLMKRIWRCKFRTAKITIQLPREKSC